MRGVPAVEGGGGHALVTEDREYPSLFGMKSPVKAHGALDESIESLLFAGGDVNLDVRYRIAA